MDDRTLWKTKTGFLLAALGSAIGLGNIWRFPYIAYRNGGGAFLIPYLVALLVVGIPLLMLEFGLGHKTRRAFPAALASIHPRFSWIGWWSVSFVMFGIVAYYAVVIAWCGNYFVFSITQPWGGAAEVSPFFDDQFLGYIENGQPFPFYTEEHGLQLGRLNWQILISLGCVWLVTWQITRRHLHSGIELANKIFIPLLIGLVLVLVAWSWGFEGAAQGREIYLKPDWPQVFEPQTWIDAFTQIFFSLSLGFGIMVAYASYLPEKTDVPTSAFLAATGNCLFSIVSAFAVFAAIGMLAADRGIDLPGMAQVDTELAEIESLRDKSPRQFDEQRTRYEELATQKATHDAFQSQMSSFGLVFKTYPAIISQMGAPGRVFGILFFLSLLVAGISSAISIVEAFIASLGDKFGVNRKKASAVLCSISFALGIVFCSQSGLFWLDLVDHFITTYGLVLVAILESLIVGWMFNARSMREHLDAHRDIQLGKSFSILMRLMVTAVLLLTWLALTPLDEAPVAGGIGRIALLAAAVILWLEEHWLEFSLRLVTPAILIFLLDQALVEEVRMPYGNYPTAAVFCIGLTWLAGTLVVAVIIDRFPGRTRSQPNARSRGPTDSH